MEEEREEGEKEQEVVEDITNVKKEPNYYTYDKDELKSHFEKIDDKINALAKYVIDSMSVKDRSEEKKETVDEMTPAEFKEHIIMSVKKELPVIFKDLMKKEREDNVREELEELERNHPDWKNVKDEMTFISMQHPKWSVSRVYDEAIKLSAKVKAPVPNTVEHYPINGGLLDKYDEKASAFDLAKKAYNIVMNKRR